MDERSTMGRDANQLGGGRPGLNDDVFGRCKYGQPETWRMKVEFHVGTLVHAHMQLVCGKPNDLADGGGLGCVGPWYGQVRPELSCV